MNYDQRKNLVTNHLGHLLSGYEPPYNLRDDQAKQLREANEIADLIVNILPVGLNPDQIAGTFERAGRELKKTAKSRSWPIAKDIIDAIRKAKPNEEGQGSYASDAQKDSVWRNGKIDPVLMSARRIKAGEALNEYHIWGMQAHELIEMGALDEQTRQRYVKGWYMEAKDVYGEAKAKEMLAQKEARHERAIAKPVEYTEHDAPQDEFVPW